MIYIKDYHCEIIIHSAHWCLNNFYSCEWLHIWVLGPAKTTNRVWWTLRLKKINVHQICTKESLCKLFFFMEWYLKIERWFTKYYIAVKKLGDWQHKKLNLQITVQFYLQIEIRRQFVLRSWYFLPATSQQVDIT